MTSTITESRHGCPCLRAWRGRSRWGQIGLVVGTLGSWAAYQLGAFVQPASPRDYIRQVEAAATQREWTAPPALNVLELTRAATDLWPDDPDIDHLRQRMANELATESAQTRAVDATRAEELARAARELDSTATGMVLRRLPLEASGRQGAADPGLRRQSSPRSTEDSDSAFTGSSLQGSRTTDTEAPEIRSAQHAWGARD